MVHGFGCAMARSQVQGSRVQGKGFRVPNPQCLATELNLTPTAYVLTAGHHQPQSISQQLPSRPAIVVKSNRVDAGATSNDHSQSQSEQAC